MNAPVKTIRIGTRGSPLALIQAHMVRDDLLKAHGNLSIDIVPIKTSGDWTPSHGEKSLTSKELFTKEIERPLHDGTIDLAVHSMKDVETFMPTGLVITHMLPREDARDCILYSNILANNNQKISSKMRVGTVSVRRQSFLQHTHPDLQFEPLRGNVETRIEKVRTGQVDATLLALAGLKRLGLEHEADEILDIETMLPAAGQGAVGIQRRENDTDMKSYLDPITCAHTVLSVMAERGILEALDGSCTTPVGAYGTWMNDKKTLRLRGWHATIDGHKILKEDQSRTIETIEEARLFGHEIGKIIKVLP